MHKNTLERRARAQRGPIHQAVTIPLPSSAPSLFGMDIPSPSPTPLRALQVYEHTRSVSCPCSSWSLGTCAGTTCPSASASASASPRSAGGNFLLFFSLQHIVRTCPFASQAHRWVTEANVFFALLRFLQLILTLIRIRSSEYMKKGQQRV
jgi:hypothetical protein